MYLYLDHFVLQTGDYALTILMILPKNNELVYVNKCQLGFAVEGQA